MFYGVIQKIKVTRFLLRHGVDWEMTSISNDKYDWSIGDVTSTAVDSLWSTVISDFLEKK